MLNMLIEFSLLKLHKLWERSLKERKLRRNYRKIWLKVINDNKNLRYLFEQHVSLINKNLGVFVK